MSRVRWQDVAERGSALGIWFFVLLVTLCGRTAGRAFLRVVILYYALLHRTARRASRDYLSRIGVATSFWGTYRHLLCFGQCLLDRIFLVRGRTDLFEVREHGKEHLERLLLERRGAILLGAHLGSFEAMSAAANAQAMPISIVVNTKNARRINHALDVIGSGPRTRIVELGDGGLDFIFRMRESIERGELVGMMGDRVGNDQRRVEVPFLGDRAALPIGAYLVAAALKCPIYLTFGVHMGGNRYDLYCEPFEERVDLPRHARQRALEELAGRYAVRLEHYCRLAPLNWFNFFDFWSVTSG